MKTQVVKNKVAFVINVVSDVIRNSNESRRGQTDNHTLSVMEIQI